MITDCHITITSLMISRHYDLLSLRHAHFAARCDTRRFFAAIASELRCFRQRLLRLSMPPFSLLFISLLRFHFCRHIFAILFFDYFITPLVSLIIALFLSFLRY